MMRHPARLDEHQCLIRIDGLKLSASIGIYPHERTERQELLVDIAMIVCAKAAAGSDDIADTVDYETVANTLESLVASRHFNLLETLSQAMLHLLADSFPVDRLDITLYKPTALPRARAVSVARHFSRESSAETMH